MIVPFPHFNLLSFSLKGWSGSASGQILTLFAVFLPFLFTNDLHAQTPTFATFQSVTGTSQMYNSALEDLDGDGKKEIITHSGNGSLVAVRRNTSSAGTISFAAVQTFGAVGSGTQYVAVDDIDGDGKRDVVCANNNSNGANGVTVLRNTSSGAGNINFAGAVSLTSGENTRTVAIGDLDGDGKKDVVAACGGGSGNRVRLFRNTSTPGSISFAASDLDAGNCNQIWGVAIGDLDGDGKGDLAIGAYNNAAIYLYRNTSTSGSISFSTPRTVIGTGTGTKPLILCIGDVDGDGKKDVVSPNETGNNVFVLRNTSSGAGNINFATTISLAVAAASWAGPFETQLADMNADGKLDIVTLNQNDSKAVVLTNNSTSGTVSFNAFAEYSVASGLLGASAADLDGDNKPDIVTTSYGGGSLSVLRNTTTPPTPTISSFTPSSGCAGSVTVTITGTNLTSASAVTIGGTAAQSFIINSPSQITATVGSGSTGTIAVTTPNGTGTSSGVFTVNARPTVAISGTTAICNGGSATLTLALTGAGTISGTLSDGTAFSGTAPSTTVSVSPSATTTYTVSTATDGTCASIAADLTGSAIISINTAPSLSATPTNSCTASNTGTATLLATGGASPYTYLWAAADASMPFMVDHMPKTAAHPYFGMGSGTGFVIDGVEGKELTLVRGVSYDFDLSMISGSHPLYITDDAIGAGAGTQYTTPSFGTVISFTPTLAMPDLLYYQCANHQYMGYKIHLVNSPSADILTNLPAGSYDGMVTDNNGCTAMTTTTVGSTTSPSLMITSPAAVCAPGTVDLTAAAVTAGSTNVGTLTYWNDMGATASLSNPNAVSVSNTYYIQADNAGCTDIEPVTATVNGAATNVVAVNGTTWGADYEETDGSGWTHYYDDNGTSTNYCDDYILLSLKKNGNAIGAIGDPGFAVEVKGAGGAVNIASNSNYVQNPDWYVMNRYWDVTPTAQPTSDVEVRFYYTTADFDAVNNSSAPSVSTHTDLKFYKVNGNMYDPNPSLGHAGIPSAASYNANGYWQYNNGISASNTAWAYGTIGSGHYGEYVVASFSGGGGGGGGTGGAFPIELVSFTGFNSGTYNALNWNTASEVNFSHFDVMRSQDGVVYENIGQVTGKGDENTSAAYTLLDYSPNLGVNYYQLRMVDKDGSHAFSNVVNISLNKDISISLYPSPTSGDVNIETRGMEGVVVLKMANALGQEVLTHTWTIDALQLEKLDISALPKGVYFYEISNKGNTQQGRIILGE